MKKNKPLKVSIVMGSQSDYKTMQLAEKTLKKIGVSLNPDTKLNVIEYILDHCLLLPQ